MRALSRGRLPVVDAVDGTVTTARQVSRVDLTDVPRLSLAPGEHSSAESTRRLLRGMSSARGFGAQPLAAGRSPVCSTASGLSGVGSTASSHAPTRSRSTSTSGGDGNVPHARRVSLAGYKSGSAKREARAARMTKLPSSEKSSRRFVMSQLEADELARLEASEAMQRTLSLASRQLRLEGGNNA